MALPSEHVIEAGIDEAGRGSLFGPVFAAACIMPPDSAACDPNYVRDSKKFTSRAKRAAAAEHIKAHAIDWSVAAATAEEIDTLNIQEATYVAMHRAVSDLRVRPGMLLVDGNRFKPYIVMTGEDDYESIPHQTIVKGDSVKASIAAASVLAKVAHDEHIAKQCEADETLAQRYGLLKNMGYGTMVHLSGIRSWGLSPGHRKSFRVATKGPEELEVE